MENSKERKGYQLTEKGKNIYEQKKGERKNDPAISDPVSRFIDEGNPNTQLPVGLSRIAADENRGKPGTQPSEVPDIGKPDPQTPAPRAENCLSQAQEDFLPVGEEESAPTIEDEIGEIPRSFAFSKYGPRYPYADKQMSTDIERALRKEGSLADGIENIHVRTTNGIVTLEGYVSSDQEKMTAGDKAGTFVGFGKVNNNILVRHP